MSERNPHKARLLCLVFLQSLPTLTAACAPGPPASPSGSPAAEYPQKDLLRCDKAGKLPAICQVGPHDRRFAELPSTKGAIARGAWEVAGQMTAEAATAKQLFDQERHAEAVPLLARVAYGETKDDAGNRQLAEYHLASALFHLGDFTGAADLFAKIAGERNHLKWTESLVWIFELTTAGCVRTDMLVALARATPPGGEEAKPDRWGRPPPGLPEAILFLSSRARFEDGRKLESVTGFRDLVDDPQWGPLARECIGLATK